MIWASTIQCVCVWYTTYYNRPVFLFPRHGHPSIRTIRIRWWVRQNVICICYNFNYALFMAAGASSCRLTYFNCFPCELSQPPSRFIARVLTGREYASRLGGGGVIRELKYYLRDKRRQYHNQRIIISNHVPENGIRARNRPPRV